MPKDDITTEKTILHQTDNLYSQLQLRHKMLDQLIRRKTKAVDHAPEGNIQTVQHSKRKDYVQYYLRTDPKQKTGKYLKKGNETLIRKLLQNEYDRKILKKAKEEHLFIGKMLRHLENKNLQNVYDSLSPYKRAWISPVIDSDEQFIQEWKERNRVQNRQDHEHVHETENHEWVRSKSEMAIANALLKAGIPYVYEYSLCDETNYWACPDFKILNPRTRQEYLWEHNGLMDDLGYVERFLVKLAKYENHGYVPGKNLLFSFENKEKPLRTSEIDLLIQTFLL